MKQLRLILFLISIAFSSNVLAQTVYTTKTGEKYHKSSCRYLKYSKKELTIDKAITLGYSACSVCKPTKENTKASSNKAPNAITLNAQSKAPSKIYYTELYIKNNITTGKYKVSQFQELFEKASLSNLGNEIQNLPLQLQGQINNELMDFILNKISVDSRERFIDVLKTINFSMVSYSVDEDNKVLKIIDEKSEELFDSKDGFIEKLQAILIENKIGYLANLISEVNINYKRAYSNTYSSSNIAQYTSKTFNDVIIKKIFLKLLEVLISSSANVKIVLNAYHLYTQAIVEDKKILRSFEANQLVKEDIEKRFVKYIDEGLLDYVHDGPDKGFEDIRNYSAPHFFLQIFSSEEAYNNLMEFPSNPVFYNKYINDGYTGYAIFLRDYLKNETVPDEIKLKVERMIKLLSKSLSKEITTNLIYEEYSEVNDSNSLSN